ncbi:MAG: hypothetical protein EXS33_01085 [Pedosphaera sp.]|nr:hypothetical protein [Pedosphaera sp.]
MNELQTIQSALDQASRRRRSDRALRGFWRGLFVGAILWLLTLAAYKLFPIPGWSLAAAAAAAGLAMLAGLVIGGWHKPTVGETARWIDARQHLQERLGTALEVAQSPASAEWKTLLLADASRHAQGLDARRLLPFHLPTVARWSVLVLAIGAGLGFAPERRSAQFFQKEIDKANIKETGKQLAELTKHSLEQRAPALEPTKEALGTVAELAQQLMQQPLTRVEALKDLANATEKLKEEARDLAKNPALKPLEKAARDSGSRGGPNPEALKKQIDTLQKSLGKGDGADVEKLQKMENALAKAKAAASKLPDKDTPEGKAAREQLAQSLSQLAQHARDAGLPMDNLEDAIQALQNGNVDQFLKDLTAAGADLGKLQNMAQAMQNAQQQMAQLGKDLAEQLKNGQTDAAQQTLQKMTEQLKTGQLTQEQLKKMLAEVSKAVDPAGDYGKVAEHLKNAVQQMQAAKQAGSDAQKAQANQPAAQALADARAELDKLAQQLADAQQLSDTIAALERAQQAIATGQGWGQCKNPGNGFNPKPGQRGTGASGVGTWTEDETGWTYYPDKVPQDPVDNSGVQRPDMAGKGQSERDESLNSALKPTKVKGQMAPGGPMPNITLKGVSIKGTSKVDFQEAATAAQTEAQSALNQDQVPRAYRGAVRDYFDDLKK